MKMTTKAKTRIEMEQYMAKHKGPHTVAKLAKAMEADEAEIRRRMQHLVCDMVVVNTTPGQRPTLYQHAKHYRKEVENPNVVSRRNPVANAAMPNGSRSYWRQHMARFNESPRAV
jgi:hypothetical protein